MTRYVFAALIGFLSGSIPFCYLLPKLLCKKDICKLSDDHNPGAANVFIHCGIPLGMLCLLLDMGKGLLPVYFASHLLDPTVLWFVPVILAPVWGHALGIFLHGHGGKCIATSFGVLIALAPISPIGLLSLAGLYIFFSTVWRIHPNSRRSRIVFSLFGVLSTVLLLRQQMFTLAIGCFGIAVTGVLRHKKVPEEAPLPVKEA